MTKWIERAAVAVFCVLLLIPCCLTLLGVQSISSENRTIAQAPTLRESGTEFSADFEAYYNDTFPLRAQLVRLNSWLSLHVLGTAPGDQVIAGKDGFLFFSETVPDYTGAREVSDDYLAELSAQLRAVQDAFAQQGTAFVLAIAPNKNSVYPEHMPAAYKPGDNSVYDRLMEQLRKDGVHAPDLKRALTEEKADHLVYHKLDTHWNDRGALTAYQAIAREAMAQNDALQLPLHDQLIFIEDTFTGDLASTMLGLSGEEKAPFNTLIGFDADSDDHYAPKLNTTSDESARFVVYRDSFGTALVPYIAQASASAFFTRALPYDFNAAAGADVVVLEIAERNIATMLQELSVPDFTAATAPDAPADLPQEPTGPDAAPREPGWDIPAPEPFDKAALPEKLSDVKNRSDEWDDYDPFSEPPGRIVTEPESEQAPEDVADYRLLITTSHTGATVHIVNGSVAAGTLTAKLAGGNTALTAALTDGKFELTGLQSGCTYAARAVLDGREINFLLQTQAADSAAPALTAQQTETGLYFTWDGEEDATYRIYRSTFLESDREIAAEVTGPEALLPHSGTLQVHYRIARVDGEEESGMSAPLTLMTPIFDLPASERDFAQQYLPLTSREDQIIYIMARDIDGKYSIPVHAMLTSTGESESRTPTGAYEFWRKREWMTWTEGQYSQYNMDFDGRLKIHSVLFAAKNHDTPIFSMREKLGRPVSGGCLRLTVTDAKWMFEHFEVGDHIEIVDGTYHPTLKQELKDTLPEL